MKTSTERPPRDYETPRPVTPLEAKTQEIYDRATAAGLESRAMMPGAAELPLAEEAIEAVSKIDFSFDARSVRGSKTCLETATMIAETLAPSIETAHRVLVSRDFYRPLNRAAFSFTRPFEAWHPPTKEGITCGGEEGRQPLERYFVAHDEHNRLTAHAKGQRLNANGLPSFIDFYAWKYAPESDDYRPLGGLHSRSFYKAEVDYPTEIWQEVELYKLADCPRLKNPAEELYRLQDAKMPRESFFLRLVEGQPRVIFAYSAPGETRSQKSLNMTHLPWWHHRPSISFGMYEGPRTHEVRYGFDVQEQTDGSWIYNHCEMNHPGCSCSEYYDGGCKSPETRAA